MNRPLVAGKLLQLTTCLRELSTVAGLPYHRFAAEPAHFRLAERDVQLAVDSAVVVNNHLIVEEGKVPPATYFETFIRLADLKVLPRPLARRLARTTALRNRIVHEYESVDLRIVHRSLREFVGDYRRYVDTVRRKTGV